MSWFNNALPLKIEPVVRYGYMAKGLIYCILGLLVTLAALGVAEGRVTGTGGVIQIVGEAVAGRTLLILLFLGLAAHVFWRFYQALGDPSEKGRGAKALVQRAGYLVSGLAYLSLTSVALGHLTTFWQGESDSDSESMAASLIATPGGSVVLGLVGLFVMGIGAYQAWRAWSQPFKDKWSTGKVSPGVLAGLASLGVASRALLFLIIGWQLARAGWFSDSNEVVDVTSALWQISTETLGNWMLGLMGIGLFLYGTYCLTNARLRRV